MAFSARNATLTPRQRRVAARVADCMTDKQIAADLRISVEAVRIHIWRIARRWNIDPREDVRSRIVRIVLGL